MPESRRASKAGIRSAVAAEDAQTAQCSAEEWVSMVPDGGWGWLVAGGSFITTVSGRRGGHAATASPPHGEPCNLATGSLALISPAGIKDAWGGAPWLRAPAHQYSGVPCLQMLMPLLNLGFGVIFSGYLLAEGTSSTTHAWLFNVLSFMWNVMGLMVRPLAQEFGWRPVANFGVLLVFVSLVTSAFTPSPSFLFFSFSLLSGQHQAHAFPSAAQ